LLFGKDELAGAGNLEPVFVPAVPNDDHALSGQQLVAGNRTSGLRSVDPGGCIQRAIVRHYSCPRGSWSQSFHDEAALRLILVIFVVELV
jgi:hypothetical protein